MIIKVIKSFNIHLLTVNEYYMLSILIKCEIKKRHIRQSYGGEEQKHNLWQLFWNTHILFNFKNLFKKYSTSTLKK